MTRLGKSLGCIGATALASAALLTVPMSAHCADTAAMPPVTLTVQMANVVRTNADHFVGTNTNYIRDSDKNRPQARPLTDALRDMGARWLRYPGGEISDFYLWSQPPYEKPNPVSLKWYATTPGNRLNFDAYIAAARKVDSEPYIVVGYATEKTSGETEAQWLESAVAWVRYANKVKHDHVRYWEIGNENWNNDKGSPEEIAKIVVEFSRAMHAVDPTIQVGASGNNNGWWSRFLPIAAPALDFINLSLYNCWQWKSYEHFADMPADANIVGDVDTAVHAITQYAPPADRSRLHVIVSEYNSKDYSPGGWPSNNTLGHALVDFESLGQVMERPKVLCAMVWTTRWMNDSEASGSQWYSLGQDNQLMPTGQAIALWGRYAQSDLVSVTGDSGAISAFATRSADSKEATVWMLNRGAVAVENVQIALNSQTKYRATQAHRLTGTGPDDLSPTLSALPPPSARANQISLSCPAYSVTVLTFTAAK